MSKYKGKILLFLAIFSFVIIIDLLLVKNSDSQGGGTYETTAHGDPIKGVDRSIVTGQPFPDMKNPYKKGHCGHCHETGDYRNIGLCFDCHEQLTLGITRGYGRYGIYQGKDKYNNSVHSQNPRVVWPGLSPPGPKNPQYGHCNNCHTPHGKKDSIGLIPSLLFVREEAVCEACHDGTPAKDISIQLNKRYSHPVYKYQGRHKSSEKGESEGEKDFGNPPQYDRRHSECVDCHNVHVLNSGLHVPPGNSVSEVLRGVWGVEPSWPGAWTQPTSFTVRKPPLYPEGAQYEYQICFKCHSYYGLGRLTSPVSLIIGPSGTNITDQAWEFNVNNSSGHPVVTALNFKTGSTSPRSLSPSQMSFQWQNTGNQTMYCSDCHGADNEERGGAKGPHGSDRRFMLKGTGQYWPTKFDGLSLWKLNPIDGSDTGLFCKNCHTIYDAMGWKNNVHSAYGHNNLECVNCHVVIPHGYKNPRLIGYAGDMAPYNYRGSSLKVTGFTKTTPMNYTRLNCTTTAGCH